MYCNTLVCIAEKRAKLYCRKVGSREDCVAIQFTVL